VKVKLQLRRAASWGVVVILVLSVSNLTAQEPSGKRYQPVDKRLSAGLCVERLEENGSINLLPSRVLVGGGDYQATIHGGQAVCFFLEPTESVEVEVRSPRPFQPGAADPDECRSKIEKVAVRKGAWKRLWVEPRSEDSTYVCGWIVGSSAPMHDR
jgi:hypothetical protein